MFLDAQVWNYLADPEWTAPSGVSSPQMLAAVEGCEVVGSFELLQELMGTERSNRAKYLDMLDNVTKSMYMDESVTSIVLEEVPAYFNNQKSAEEVSALIQDRVQTLVNERS